MASRPTYPFWITIRAYLVLPHATPIIIVLLATAAFAFVATKGDPGASRLIWLLVAMLGGQMAVGATNELVDVDLDRISKPYKPIPAGLVSRRGALTVAVIGLLLMILGSLRFSVAAGLICALGTGLGIAYSLWFKRTVWAWLPYVLAIPLLPIWVWTALSRPPAAMLFIYPIAVPALTAVYIAQSVPDIAADRSAGIRNLTTSLGPRNALMTCWSLMLLAILAAVVSAPYQSSSPSPCWLAGGVALALVILDALLWRRDHSRGLQMCFPLVAAAVVVVGLGWAISTLG